MRNTSAGEDVRFARTGKDGMLFDGSGNALASVESFQAQATYNNAQYSVLGSQLELETPNTYGVTLTFSQIVIESDKFLEDMMEAMQTGTMPEWNFQGSLLGYKDGDGEPPEERVAYYRCVPSGAIDIQNLAVGDVIKRSWSFHCNEVPKLLSKMAR